MQVTLLHEVFDANGNHRGTCRVTVEGARGVGGVVTFKLPIKPTVVNAIPGELAEMERMGVSMV